MVKILLGIANVFENKISLILVLSVAIAGQAGCSRSDNDASSPQSRLNDTGITWGGNYPRGVNEDCSARIDREQLPEGDAVKGDILPQQDCTRGRDTSANTDRDSAAGFVYRKISENGEMLNADAREWSCVLDEITGLLWEVKQPADGTYGNTGLHDGDDVFMWYNSNRRENAGAIGDWNSRYNQCSGYTEGEPKTYCNIEQFAARVNKKGLCGFNDWRVPTRPELAGLVHFGRTEPAVDTAYFPHTQEGFYWSNSPDAKLQARAWAVNFQFGYSAAMPRDNSRSVRLVRDWNGEPAETESGGE